MPRKTDAYANKFYATVTETGASTLTYKEINTSVDIFTKRAWILHALEYYTTASMASAATAVGDKIQMALTSSDKPTSLDLSDAAIIDVLELHMETKTEVGFEIAHYPIRRSFNDMPGGGLIISPRPLFLAVRGVGIPAAVTISCRGYFTTVDLSAEEFIDLVDFYRIVS